MMALVQRCPKIDRAGRALQENGPQALFCVVEDGKTIASALTGVDRRAVRISGAMRGYFAQFEAQPRQDAVSMLFAGIAQWQRAQGMSAVFGPIAVDGSGFEMGVKQAGFDRRRELLNPDNPPYYDPLLRDAGLAVETRWLSFEFDIEAIAARRYMEAANWARSRHGIHIERLRPLQDRRDCERLYAAMEIDGRIEQEAFAAQLQRISGYMGAGRVLLASVDGAPRGMLMALHDRRQRHVRIATVHVMQAYQGTPVLVALMGGMAQALGEMRPRRLSASLIDETNERSVAVAMGAFGQIGGAYCQYVGRF